MELVPMTDYVLNKNKIGMEVQSLMHQSTDRAKRFYDIVNYAKLLKTPLNIGMFIPCDKNGSILEEPYYWKGYNSGHLNIPVVGKAECEIYREANAKVLFEVPNVNRDKKELDQLIEGETIELMVGSDTKLIESALGHWIKT